MSPFKVGDRVVVHIPEPVVGVVRCLTAGGDVVVDAGSTSAEVAASGVRPAMPRDQADIDKYGRYWWRGDKVGQFGISREYFFYDNTFDKVDPKDDWRGPVARPPEVRP